MKQIRLKAYKGKEKQHFISITNQFVGAGVTDIRLMQQMLLDDFNDDLKNNRLKMSDERKKTLKKRDKETAEINSREENRCPECGNLDMRIYISELPLDSNTKVFEVVKECFKCKWSKLLETREVIIKKHN